MVLMPHDDPSGSLKSKKNTTFPPIPKRGKVKARIFESFAKTLVSAASSMAKGDLIRNGRYDGEETGSSSSSGHPTPTPTPNSD